MCIIYFEDKVINFTDTSDASCDRELTLPADGEISITKMLENLENSKRLCGKADDPAGAFERFQSRFTAVEAAGGVVRNADGQVLMIYRRGKWDLPKGHVEQGESPLQAAVREVGEETGLTGATPGKLITATYHFYNTYGRWEMKRTWWYAMESAESETTPQTEEDIMQVVWVGPGQIAECARDTYSSILAVLRKADLI